MAVGFLLLQPPLPSSLQLLLPLPLQNRRSVRQMYMPPRRRAGSRLTYFSFHLPLLRRTAVATCFHHCTDAAFTTGAVVATYYLHRLCCCHQLPTLKQFCHLPPSLPQLYQPFAATAAESAVLMSHLPVGTCFQPHLKYTYCVSSIYTTAVVATIH